jgi:uncharacterized protein (DUF1015 family)
VAEIKPFRAWRYKEEFSPVIDELTSPLFDVVSDRQRQALYQNPFNSIHLSVPEPPRPADRAKEILKEWKRFGTIVQDKIPGIYVYYQYFKLTGSPREYCRKGFMTNIRAYDWDEKIILRHENTIPKSVNDRTELLEKTLLHVSATHGLYTDENFAIEKYMDEAITDPLYETEDYQGVRDVLAVIQDASVIKKIISTLADKKVILADGHHRYESSLIFKNKKKKANPHHTGKEAYNFHLMYLTNTEAGDLKILPTHRLVRDLHRFDQHQIIMAMENDFIVKPVDEPSMLEEIIAGKQWTFGIIFKDSAFKVRLKPEVFDTMRWHFPPEIKALDLTVLHYFIIEKILGIPGKDQRSSEKIEFNRSFSDCMTAVLSGTFQMAIITQEISIEEVKKVCDSGFTMPQKSTFFYPKVICGFLFSSIQEDEFHIPAYSGF